MKKCLSLPLIVLALLTTFVWIGCGAKQTPSVTTPATAEATPAEEVPEMHEQGESAEETEEHESAEETEEHESAEEASEHEADEEHESAEEASEHEADEEHESAEETEEHESAEETEAHEADEEHESAEETEEHTSDEEHESAEETPGEAAPEMEEIPDNSVLHLIPQETMGLIYCPSLLELDYRINTLVTDLNPTDDTPEILAEILADSFDAGFESLAELEEIGLDLNQDFVVFMSDGDPPDISALVHLKDPEAIKQVIDAESEGGAPTEHNGEIYWSAAGAEGHFAILENILVFSRSAEVCESVIDTYKDTQQSVTTNPGYTSFLNDLMAGDAQLGAHFDIESIVPLLIDPLQEESESMRDDLESDPTAMAFVPFFTSMFESAISTLEQTVSISATLEVKGTDVQLAPSLKFQADSEIQNSLKEMIPNELAVLNDLPNLAVVNGALQGNSQLLLDLNLLSLKMFAAGSLEHQEQLAAVTEQLTVFYNSLGDEWGFTVNFGNSLLPDYLIVYEMEDKELAKNYMDEMFLEQLHNTMRIMQETVGDMPQFGIYEGAHAGVPLLHNDVEIKSYVFPHFGTVFDEMGPEVAAMMPQEWQWYYAFHEDQLFFAVGSADLIQAALDRKSGMGGSLSENPSYQKLTDILGTTNNLLLALSPMTMVKSLIPIVANADPEAGAVMQMFAGLFMDVPETYSIGFAAKAQEDSIDAKLLLTLGDFKRLIEVIVMIQNMQQMQ